MMARRNSIRVIYFGIILNVVACSNPELKVNHSNKEPEYSDLGASILCHQYDITDYLNPDKRDLFRCIEYQFVDELCLSNAKKNVVRLTKSIVDGPTEIVSIIKEKDCYLGKLTSVDKGAFGLGYYYYQEKPISYNVRRYLSEEALFNRFLNLAESFGTDAYHEQANSIYLLESVLDGKYSVYSSSDLLLEKIDIKEIDHLFHQNF